MNVLLQHLDLHLTARFLPVGTFLKDTSQGTFYLLTIRIFGIGVRRWVSAETAAEVIPLSLPLLAAVFCDAVLLQTLE